MRGQLYVVLYWVRQNCKHNDWTLKFVCDGRKIFADSFLDEERNKQKESLTDTTLQIRLLHCVFVRKCQQIQMANVFCGNSE